jgi:hypothetical protein
MLRSEIGVPDGQLPNFSSSCPARLTATTMSLATARAATYEASGLLAQSLREGTPGTVSVAGGSNHARTLRTAPVGSDWGQTRPLVLLQQTAKLGVLCSQRTLCVTHGLEAIPDVQAAPKANSLPLRAQAQCRSRADRIWQSVRVEARLVSPGSCCSGVARADKSAGVARRTCR